MPVSHVNKHLRNVNKDLDDKEQRYTMRQAVDFYARNSKARYGDSAFAAKRFSQPMSEEAFNSRVAKAAATYRRRNLSSTDEAIKWAHGWAADKGMYIETIEQAIARVKAQHSPAEQASIDKWIEDEKRLREQQEAARKARLDAEERNADLAAR